MNDLPELRTSPEYEAAAAAWRDADNKRHADYRAMRAATDAYDAACDAYDAATIALIAAKAAL